MNFLEVGNTMINLDHVREVYRRWNKNPEMCGVTVTYQDGTSDRFEGQPAYLTFSGLEEKLGGTVVGSMQLLRFWFYDTEPNAAKVIDSRNREPIIAWRVTHYGPTPVTLEDGPGMDSGKEAILRADGEVVDPMNCSWADIDAWAEYVCEKWTEWREKKRKEKTAS